MQKSLNNFFKERMNEIIPFGATQMDLEIIILSEGSQIEKGKCHITPSFLKMIQMNLFTKQKQTYRY